MFLIMATGFGMNGSGTITFPFLHYLAEIDEQAKDMFFRLVKEYAGKQRVTEQLKADKPLEWVQKMNNIRSIVEEVINTELIYA